MTTPTWVSPGAGTSSASRAPAGVPYAAFPPMGAQARGAQRARAWLAFPILVGLYALIGPYSLYPPAATGQDAAVGASAAAAASAVQEGTPTRRIGVLLLAGFAALTLSAARRRRVAVFGHARATAQVPAGERHRFLPFLLVLYIGVAFLSALRADDTTLAAKRLFVFLVVVFAAYALAQAWSLREIVHFTIFANGTSLILGIGGALARHDFTPFAPDYRFVGFSNPNLHGIEAACLVIASITAFRLRGNERWRGLLAALAVFGVGMLLLTKSRTALAGLVMAGMVSAGLAIRSKRLMVLLALALSLVFAVVVFAPESVSHAHNAALLGRSSTQEDPATLTGRTLLWNDLLYYAADRPWLGYGYGSFWSPDHIAEVSLRRGWVITQSHSGYIETLMNVGYLGVSMLVLVLFAGLFRAMRHFRRTRTAIALFSVGIIAWYIVNMMAEAIPEEHFSTLVIMMLLAHLALRRAAPDDWEADAVPAGG